MKYLYILLFLALSFSTQAAEYLGGEITWKCIGSDSFLITVTVYTDCNANDSIDTSLTVRDSLGSYNVGLSLVSTEDITNVCDSFGSRCDSSSSVFPYGIQKNVLTAIVDISNYSGCILNFTYEDCCRPTVFGSIDFILSSSFNRCLAPCSNSPEFTENPIGIMCSGECVIYSPGATYPQGDSLFFSLTPPLTNIFSHSPFPYPSPYSYDKPLYFNGFPNAGLPFNPPLCRGFHLGESTGDLYFRPMQQQRSQMAIKCEIYRNGIKTGEVIRDMHLTVINCPPNNSPTITGINGGGNFNAEACPGSTLTFNINSDDQDSTDSLTMEWDEGIPGATFSTGTGRTPTSTFSWTPTQADIRSEPYVFKVKVKDNACPVNSSVMRTFQITVKPLPYIEYQVINNGCGSFTFQIDSISPSGTLVEWSGAGGIGTGNGGQDAQSHQFTHRFLQEGTYPFELKGIADCIGTNRDTLVVDSVVDVELPADTILFRGDSTLLTANIHTGIGPLQYLWLPGSSTANSIYAAPDSSGNVFVAVTDSIGCTGFDTIYIEVWDEPSPSWISYTDSCGKLRFMVDSAHIYPSSEFAWRFNDTITGINAELMADVPANGSFPLELLITSPLLKDTFLFRDTISVTEIATIEITAPDSACVNSPELLKALPQGGSMPYSFTWSLSNSSYNADSVIYSLTEDTTVSVIFTNAEGCTAYDTTRIIVHEVIPVTCQPSLDLCLNSINKNLNNVCNYVGEWQGPGVVDSMFYPTQAGTGNHVLQFEYTDGNQCIYKDSVEVTVKTLPAVSVTSLPPLCINSDSVSLFSRVSPLNGTWSGTGIKAPFHFHPKIAGLGSHELVYTYRGSNGCYNSDTLVAEVHALPMVDAGPGFSICLNESKNMGGQPTGGTWSGPGIVSGNTLRGALADTGNHQFIYNYTDSNGCASRDTLIAEVKTLPTVDAGADFSVCQSGAPLSLGGMPAGGNWSGKGVTGAQFDPATAGTGTHALFYEYTSGCTNTDTVYATVTAPAVGAGPDTAFCLTDAPVVFHGQPGGGTWSGTGIQNDTFRASVSGAGTFTLTYSYTDTGQCIATDEREITVHPLPQFTPDYEVINPPTEVEFSLITTEMLSNYLWYFGDGSTSILPDPTHHYAAGDTTYNAYVTASGQFECRDTVHFQVILKPTGITEESTSGLRIFPNPVSQILNIEVQEAWQNGRIMLLDLQGKVLHQQDAVRLAPGETYRIDMQGLAQGTYLLQLVNSQEVQTVRIVNGEL